MERSVDFIQRFSGAEMFYEQDLAAFSVCSQLLRCCCRPRGLQLSNKGKACPSLLILGCLTSLGNTKRGRAAKPEASIYTSILQWRACKKKTTQIFVWPPELGDGWAQRWIYGFGALLPSKKKVALGRLFTPVSFSFVPKSLLIYARLDINYFVTFPYHQGSPAPLFGVFFLNPECF